MMVVKWSACLPSTPTIWVRDPAEVYSLNSVNLLEKNEKRPTATSTPRLKRLSAKFGSKIATIEPLSKILSNHKI